MSGTVISLLFRGKDSGYSRPATNHSCIQKTLKAGSIRPAFLFILCPREFLASFAVDIDESGVNRLRLILDQNRELAEKLAGGGFNPNRVKMVNCVQ